MLQTLLPEILRHLIQVMLTSPIRLARIHIAIAYEKMSMDMISIGMHSEQHFKTFAMNKVLSEILCNLESCLVIDIIQRVKRDRHLVREDSVVLVLRVAFPVQLARDQNSIREILTVAAEGGVKPLGGFPRTAFDLLLFPPEHIVRRSFQRPDRLAGRIINVDVPERHLFLH